MLSDLPPRTRSHAIRLLVPALLWAALIPPAPSAAIPAVSFESAGSGCGPHNVEGWQFQTTAALAVSAIGAFDYQLDGLQHDIPVGIFDSNWPWWNPSSSRRAPARRSSISTGTSP